MASPCLSMHLYRRNSLYERGNFLRRLDAGSVFHPTADIDGIGLQALQGLSYRISLQPTCQHHGPAVGRLPDVAQKFRIKSQAAATIACAIAVAQPGAGCRVLSAGGQSPSRPIQAPPPPPKSTPKPP